MKKVAGLYKWLIVAVLVVSFPSGSLATPVGSPENWPLEILVDGDRVIMYQPQPEKYDGDEFAAMAAVSIITDQEEEPVFGAIWFDARLSQIRNTRKAKITDVNITTVRFPKWANNNVEQIKSRLEIEMIAWKLEIDIDLLFAALELEEKRRDAAKKINTQPPKIIFVNHPAALITIDGEPRLKQIKDSDLMRVVNTPFSIIFNPSENRYYLYANEDNWYVSRSIEGKWEVTENVPPYIAILAPKQDDETQERLKTTEELTGKEGAPPVIYVATEPTEIISSKGEPEYSPIRGTNLLYMSNTESDVLLYIMDRKYYILLSGRWYRSTSLRDSWENVAGEELPSDFKLIPEDSHMAKILYSVPGTKAAKVAVLDANIPRTAAVDPGKASLTVIYDGKPKFDKIRGTNLYYAVNTEVPVIWAGKWYYACDEGVWFVAPSPKGPWKVATSIPDAIYLIPPDNPVYHVTFVRIYDARPDVVYVGYTSGYTHTYVYYDTIVYGTGYYWPGWYGHYYYPRPRTWGYHTHWTPWYGWGSGVSYRSGSFRFSIGFGDWYRGSWWGPDYYWDHYDPYYYGYRDRHRPRYWNKRKYYRDHPPPPPPRKTYPGRPSGPKEEWLQHKSIQPPRPKSPSRTVTPERPQPKPKYNPNWGTQHNDPRPPDLTPERPQTKPQYNPNWGTQHKDPSPPDQSNNVRQPGSGRIQDFHGTIGPRGGGSPK